MENRRKALIEQLLFLLVLGISLAVGLKLLFGLFSPLLFGFAIAYILRPISRTLMRSSRMGQRTSSMVAALVFYLSVTFILIALSAYLFGQISILLQGLPALLTYDLFPFFEQHNARVVQWLSGLSTEMGIGAQNIFDTISTALMGWVSAASSYLAAIVSGFLGKLPIYLLGAVFTVLLSVFIGSDYSAITAFILRQLSPAQQRLAAETSAFFKDCLGKLLRAYAIILLITAIELSFGLFVLGASSPIPTGITIALLDILPVIGSGSVLLPWALLSLISNNTAFGAGLLILFGIISVVRNIIEPKIVGGQIGLHPVVTITVMFAGLRLMGVGGVLSAPMVALFIKHLNSKGIIHLYR